MIIVDMFSSADKVAGQGVGSVYAELVRMLEERLDDQIEVRVNDRRRADITHYHTIDVKFYLSTFFSKRGRKVGFVHFLPETLEGSLKFPKFVRKILYRYVISFYRRMDQLIVVNPTFIPMLVKYGIDEDKITYIPNFVAADAFPQYDDQKRRDLRASYHLPQDKFIVMGSGQVQKRKGIDDFAKVAMMNPDIQFVWAGGFSFGMITDGYERYKKLIENPPKNLLFTGIVKRQQVAELLNAVDMFFLPSYDELFPMSVLEAYSCGKPVLVRDLTLYQAILPDLYVAAQDAEGFSYQINRLKNDEVSYQAEVKKAHLAANQYSEERLAKIWLHFYRDQSLQAQLVRGATDGSQK